MVPNERLRRAEAFAQRGAVILDIRTQNEFTLVRCYKFTYTFTTIERYRKTYRLARSIRDYQIEDDQPIIVYCKKGSKPAEICYMN